MSGPSAYQVFSSEFMARLGQDRLWKYIKSVHAGADPEQIATSFLDPTERSLLSLALKYRIFSAKIAVHESLLPQEAPQCETFAQLGDEYFCNAENLESALEEEEGEKARGESTSGLARSANNSTELSKHHLDYGHPFGSRGRLVLVYSEIRSASFESFATALEPMMAEGRVRIIYRHLVRRDCVVDPSELRLFGFGLEVDVKSYGGEAIALSDTALGLASPPEPDLDTSQLGLQLVQAVLDAKDPLSELTHVVENAPLLLNALAKVRVSQDVVDKVTQLAQHVGMPESFLAINGAEVSIAHFNIQSLLGFLIDYQGLLHRHLAPFPLEQRTTLAHKIMASSLQPNPVRFNVRTSAAIVLNNLEKDERYRMWPKSLRSLLRPPTGQFYPLARNLVAVTIVLDVDSISERLLRSIASMVSQMVPMQIILVLHSTSGDANLLNALHAVHQSLGTMAFLELLHKVIAGREQDEDQLSVEALYDLSPAATVPLSQLIARSKAAAVTAKASGFAKKYGAGPKPLIFVNGRLLDFDESNWQRSVVKMYQEEIYRVQMALASNEIGNDDDADNEYLENLIESEDNFTSRHPKIFLDKHRVLSPQNPPQWLYTKAKPITYSVVLYLNLNRAADIQLLTHWLRYLEREKDSPRLGVVLTCESASRPVRAAIDGLASDRLSIAEALGVLKGEESSLNKDRTGSPCDQTPPIYQWPDATRASSGPAATINGVLFGPFEEEEELSSLDCRDWLRYYRSRFGARHQSTLEEDAATPSDIEDPFTPLACFEVELSAILARNRNLFNGDAAMEIPPQKVCHLNLTKSLGPGRLLNIQILLNPFSATAARILATLEELDGLIAGTLIPNVLPEYTHLPATNLYRFRGLTGHLSPPLPRGTKFALMPSTPPAWDLEEASNQTDLDNLTATGETLEIKLGLRGLILEGEVKSMLGGLGLPNVPVQLSSLEGKPISKSMSITGLGYYQLRAPPGVHRLAIPQNGGLTLEGDDSTMVVVDGLGANLKRALLQPKEGQDHTVLKKENVPLLFAEQSPRCAHVFTIASGATYERLVKIMMYSVTKHSSVPVKFWILANFVSPAFETSLQLLAEKLNFSFELIRFKWPAWLNGQARKFRRVWAFKILFLDLLPYSVDRLIYVDADQVMRSDIAELTRLDMKGHVYGFVPFCESRSETAHLQFWKSGYWKEYLGENHQYHISALYVIDMEQLRVQGAADRLRSHYQMLSYDPASLANLDQDLPNNLQHEFPIFPLPSEWLWCETWCDDRSKTRAKSIDLCNNPLRDESKLDQAQRIIPEWTTYDRQVARLLQQSSSSPEGFNNDDDDDNDDEGEETVMDRDEL